jgi:hypothetical protein
MFSFPAVNNEQDAHKKNISESVLPLYFVTIFSEYSDPSGDPFSKSD